MPLPHARNFLEKGLAPTQGLGSSPSDSIHKDVHICLEGNCCSVADFGLHEGRAQ